MLASRTTPSERAWRLLNYIVVSATLLSAGYLIIGRHVKSSDGMEQYKQAVQKFEANIYEKKLEVYK